MNVGAKRCHNWWRTRWRDILAIPALAAGGQPLRGVVNVHERSVIMRGRGVCKSWTRRGEDCRSSAELRASGLVQSGFLTLLCVVLSVQNCLEVGSSLAIC